MHNKQRRPDMGGAAAIVLADRPQFTITYTECHAPNGAKTADQAAFCFVVRHGVRPSLAVEVAAIVMGGAR